MIDLTDVLEGKAQNVAELNFTATSCSQISAAPTKCYFYVSILYYFTISTLFLKFLLHSFILQDFFYSVFFYNYSGNGIRKAQDKHFQKSKGSVIVNDNFFWVYKTCFLI